MDNVSSKLIKLKTNVIMKNILKNIGLLVFTGVLFTACDEDDFTGASQIEYSPATVTLSSLSPTVFDESAIDEDDASTYEITIDATLAAAQPTEAIIDLMQVGGSADGSDFHAGTISIAAGDTSGSATVEILRTGDVEGDETLSIGGKARANFNVAAFEHTVTIQNDYINDVLDLELNWDGEFSVEDDFSSATYDFCGIDFDVLIYDAGFADTGIYDAATGACPEHVGFGPGMADGDYYIVVDLWSNPYSGLGAGVTVPVALNYSQEFFETSGSIPTAAYTTDAAGGTIAIAIVTKSGNDYTVVPY